MDVKSGKGIRDGVVSELAAFFRVKPGEEEELRAACARFADALRAVSELDNQKIGLRDSRHVIFDDGRRLMWTTTFETDWDPYLDDAMMIFGVDNFIDWMKHIEEAEVLKEWMAQAGGRDALNETRPEVKAKTVAVYSGGLKKIIQSAQVPASGYFNPLGGHTMPQIRKNDRVASAFQAVLDDPAAEQALTQPALKPLLAEAAD
ncbi:MAG: hypothetical protein ACT4RN_17240 [Pseudonocardia sp.]